MSSYKAYFAIESQIKQLGVHVTRAELVEGFTNGVKSGLSDLTATEYNMFISWLQSHFDVNKNKGWQDTSENKMRRKIWVLFCQKMGFSKKEMYTWAIKKGKFKKPLKEHNLQELTVLVTQAEKVYESFLKEVNK